MSTRNHADPGLYVRVTGMEVFKGVKSVLPGANIIVSLPKPAPLAQTIVFTERRILRQSRPNLPEFGSASSAAS